VEAVESSVRAHTHFSAHQRTWALLPKCGAKTRSGRPCLGLVVRGKRRCRMHGGAARSGAQPGNRNRRRHGRFSRDVIEGRALLRLSVALNALLDANVAVIAAISRGDHGQFERLAAATEAKREAALAAGASYRRFLTQVGRADEAEALAADITATAVSPSASQLRPPARTATAPTPRRSAVRCR